MNAGEIERVTMDRLREMRSGLPPLRLRALEAEILALHETLVRNMAWYFFNSYLYQTSTIDDLYQAGRIGVLHAIRSFNPKKCQVFGMHAYSRIRRSLQQFTVLDRIVRVTGTKNARDYWAPPMRVFDKHDAGYGDMRDDVEAIQRASEIERYDLSKKVDRVTKRKIRRRFRQKELI